VLTAVVTHHVAGQVQVHLVAQDQGTAESTQTGPSPIKPELKELAWGAGAFIVFALLMRFFLFPRLKKGMDARYGAIRSEHEEADRLRATAQAEVAEYQQALAQVKAEAANRVEAARAQLDAERTAGLAAVNARIAERRAAAAAEAEAAKAAAREHVENAVATVASTITEMAIGKAPSSAAVQRAVADVVSVGAGR
jgi:F-type H+-transporting ATPase subunit b